MSTDRRWAAKYQEMLTGYIDALGGKEITPPRKALAEQIAVLQTELAMLTDRFASGGRGGSAEDLAIYLRLSDSAAELMQTAGLASSLQAPIVDHDRRDDADAENFSNCSTISFAPETKKRPQASSVMIKRRRNHRSRTPGTRTTNLRSAAAARCTRQRRNTIDVRRRHQCSLITEPPIRKAAPPPPPPLRVVKPAPAEPTISNSEIPGITAGSRIAGHRR